MTDPLVADILSELKIKPPRTRGHRPLYYRAFCDCGWTTAWNCGSRNPVENAARAHDHGALLSVEVSATPYAAYAALPQPACLACGDTGDECPRHPSFGCDGKARMPPPHPCSQCGRVAEY